MNIHVLRCIFGTISLGLGLVVLFGYIFLSGLRKPPGMLIFWQTVLQILMDIEWGVVGFYKFSLGEGISETACWVLGIFTIYSYFVGWNYILCLIIEMIIKLKDPMNGNYKKRSPLYHAFSHLLGLSFSIFAGARADAGESLILTCFLREQS